MNDLLFASIEEQIKDFRHLIPGGHLAQHGIGNFYYHIMKDYGRAFHWFKLAADQNHADSKKMLSHMSYENQLDFEDSKELMETSNWDQSPPVVQEVFSGDSFIDRFFDGLGKIITGEAFGRNNQSGIDWHEQWEEVVNREQAEWDEAWERSERKAGGSGEQAQQFPF